MKKPSTHSIYFIPLVIIYLINSLNSWSQSKQGSSTSYKPVLIANLPDQLKESSGLIYWNKFLWSHNDDKDTNLYAVDPQFGTINKTIQLNNVTNTEWEDIAQDSSAIYIADTGNNVYGNRKDLHLLRIDKKSLETNNQTIDTINFVYSDQTDFNSLPSNTTDFDLESLVVTKEQIFLFSKQWKSRKTTLYQLSKQSGNQVAQAISSFDAQGLITGATLIESQNKLVLCGYTSLLSPFLIVFYDYTGNNFFSGKSIRIKLDLPFHQIEGITTTDGNTFYLSNEKLNFKGLISNSQAIWKLDLSQIKY